MQRKSEDIGRLVTAAPIAIEALLQIIVAQDHTDLPTGTGGKSGNRSMPARRKAYRSPAWP